MDGKQVDRAEVNGEETRQDLFDDTLSTYTAAPPAITYILCPVGNMTIYATDNSLSRLLAPSLYDLPLSHVALKTTYPRLHDNLYPPIDDSLSV